MRRKLYRAKSRGQSIPLFALMFAVLAGFAALSLDAGNMYAQQRSVVRATNAAAIEGMDAIINDFTIEDVRRRVQISLRSNGLDAVYEGAQPNQVTIKGQFLDAAGNDVGVRSGCSLASCSSWEGIKRNVTYLRLDVGGYYETYFARVVGQEQLPVKWAAHAARGACADGIYPISVNADLLNLQNRTFKEPDRIYTDEIYRNRGMKRIFMRDVGLAGNFGWLRWDASNTSSGSARALGQALAGTGTLADGFTEGNWPTDNQGQSLVPIDKPDGYPLNPGRLNTGDWLGGSSGLSNSNDVRTQLDLHINNRTIMTLPIYDYAVGNGVNSSFHVIDFGKFYLRDYGRINPNSAESDQYGGQSGWYLDLVYIGGGSECATLTPPPVVIDTIDIEGQVSLYPHYTYWPDAADAPIQYVIVLDVSGSMSWNFAGYGTKNGATVLCQGTGAVQCPASSPHPDEAQRRITVAHGLLRQFVESVRPEDQVRIVTFSGAYDLYGSPNPPSLNEALGLSRVYPDEWTSDKPTLLQAVDDAASFNNTFLTSGETPSSIGLARALQIYSSSRTRDPITNQVYKRATIFLTDGVANVTRNGLLNYSPTCGAEDIACQDGTFPNDPNTLKPIPAMNDEAANLKSLIGGPDNGDGGVFVISLGPTNQEALMGVTESNQMWDASDPAALTNALAAIRAVVQDGACQDGVVRTSATTQIQGSSLPDYSLPAIVGKIQSPEMGVVTLVGADNTVYSGKIVWNAASGTMSYRVEDLPPGQYRLSYWMAYRSPEDQVTRIYNHALPINGGSLVQQQQTMTLVANAQVFNAVNQPLVLDFDPGVSVCEGAVRP